MHHADLLPNAAAHKVRRMDTTATPTWRQSS